MISHSPPVLIYRLFPQFLEAKWGYFNLNESATDFCTTVLRLDPKKENPFLDQYFLSIWMNYVHRTKGIDYSWGGYLEDRSTLWRGHYQKPGECVHLGIDVNVPAGTPVSMPVTGTLVHSFQDPDQIGGWGGKLIFKCQEGYLILGHLDEIPTDLGTLYPQGKKVGIIAEEKRNGGWFPHLHVQRANRFVADVDGYSAYYDGIESIYPNPVEL